MAVFSFTLSEPQAELPDFALSSNPSCLGVVLCFRGCSQRSSELHRAKKDIKSEVEERYLLNAEEIAQVWQPEAYNTHMCRIHNRIPQAGEIVVTGPA